MLLNFLSFNVWGDFVNFAIFDFTHIDQKRKHIKKTYLYSFSTCSQGCSRSIVVLFLWLLFFLFDLPWSFVSMMSFLLFFLFCFYDVGLPWSLTYVFCFRSKRNCYGCGYGSGLNCFSCSVLCLNVIFLRTLVLLFGLVFVWAWFSCSI